MDLPSWAIELIKQVGPFAVILVILFWYVPRDSVRSFIKSQADQAVALSGIKDALATMVDRGSRSEEKLDATMLNQRLMVGKLEEMERQAERHRHEMLIEMQNTRELMIAWTKNIAAEKFAG